MEKGIRFKLIWQDSDMREIELSAWNGEFGGVARIYVGHGELVGAAKALAGFPQTANDERKFVLGNLNRDGLGGATLRFYMRDMAGHAAVEVSLYAGADRTGHFQTATLHAGVEGAAMDEFVLDLGKIEDDVDATAFLKTSS